MSRPLSSKSRLANVTLAPRPHVPAKPTAKSGSRPGIGTRNAKVDEIEKLLAKTTLHDAGQEASELPSSIGEAEELLKTSSRVLSTVVAGSSSCARLLELAQRQKVALRLIRQASNNPLDIDRRSSTLVNRLLSLEAKDAAFELLEDIRMSVLSMYEHEPPSSDCPYLFPLPSSSTPVEFSEFITITLMQYLHAHLPENAQCIADLSSPGSLWHWTQYATDLTLKRAYSALIKCEAFAARAMALKILLKTSELGSEVFWTQTCHFGVSYAKSAPLEKQNDVSIEISTAYGEIIRLAEQRQGFLEGENFVKFCKHWMSFARKNHDLRTLDKISTYLKATPARDVALEKAQLYGLFVKINSLLSHNALTNEFPSQVRECLERMKQLQGLMVDDQMLEESHSLRKAAIKWLQAQPKHDSNKFESVSALILGLSRKEALRESLDSLFVLAQTGMNPSDQATWKPTLDILNTAVDLISSARKGGKLSKELSHIKHAELLRFTAGTVYKLGGNLFKEARYSGALIFLQRYVGIAQLALDYFHQLSLSPADDDLAHWDAFKERLSRGWELLGICHLKINDRRAAHKAYVESLKTTFANPKATLPIPSLDVSLIHRTTFIAVNELFMGRGASMYSVLNEVCQDRAILAAVLEEQVAGLADFSMTEGAVDLLTTLLHECAEIYGTRMPMRHVRILLRLLENEFASASSGIDSITVVKQIEELLRLQDLKDDIHLATLGPFYAASAKIWRALILDRSQQACGSKDSPNQSFITSLIDAADILASAKDAGIPSVGKRKEDGAVEVELTSRTGRSRAPSRAVSKASVRGPKPPKTPARKNAISEIGKAIPVPKVTDEVRAEIIRSLNLADTAARMLGLMGHVQHRLHFLESVRNFVRPMRQAIVDAYVPLSLQLAAEYGSLGLVSLAVPEFKDLCTMADNQELSLSDELRVQIYLRKAEFLTSRAALEDSEKMYLRAWTIAEMIPEEPRQSSMLMRVKSRLRVLERTALAARVYSSLQGAKNEPVLSLDALERSSRLWNRAAETLMKQAAVSKPASQVRPDSPNPFDVPAIRPSPSGTPPPSTAVVTTRSCLRDGSTLFGAEWRVIDGLVQTLFLLCQMSIDRGSPKHAEYYLQQREDLVGTLRSPLLENRTLASKSELLLLVGKLQEASDSISRAAARASSPVDEAYIDRVLGDYQRLSHHDTDALQSYSTAAELLSKPYENETSFRKDQKKTTEPLLPELLLRVLQNQVWLLRDATKEECDPVIKRYLDLHEVSPYQDKEGVFMGRLVMHDAYDRFKTDLFLSSLTESTIAIPVGMTFEKSLTLTPTARDVITRLGQAEKQFWAGLDAHGQSGPVWLVREAAVTLALISSFNSSLGRSSQELATITANLLDAGAAVTIRREMRDAIQAKLAFLRQPDDLKWSRIEDLSDSPSESSTAPARPKRLRSPPSDLSIQIDAREEDLNSYWRTIDARYRAERFNPSQLSPRRTKWLPDHWTVVSVSVTEDLGTMLLTRQRAGRTPLILCIPLDRHGRKDQDDSTFFTFTDAMDELNEIISTSNIQARDAKSVQGHEAKVDWWNGRRTLNGRLKELLETIEYCWLGAFKMIFSAPVTTGEKALTDLRNRLETVVEPALQPDKKIKTLPRLDDDLLECISTLSPQCRDEELEDLVYFILDLYQFHGIPVALHEVDVDQMVVDLRSALEDHARQTAHAPETEGDQHLFLVLDKHVQGIPWESLPCLRGRAISRLPSVSFLYDRILLARLRRGLPLEPVEGEKFVIDRMSINPCNAYYVLNPSGDLKSTEQAFSEWMKSMEAHGWQGVIGRAPSEMEVLGALQKHDLFIYFGHGSGAQYARNHKVRNLRECAATMLWGCSSGTMRQMGEFDNTGTPSSYMLAGW
ncbi:hypothetical protein SISNIDRAFT_438021 [Sistotremastrum niveocremeum HHB9708]|uniref:separase n=1 Tax=Sistotremastrum niveocremeum HHB9708 TaxID=1314777 RepID=A0A164XTI8_9AGAM|nr:hypothetical protein SISNIDRAFT_438021 [Sistotremastrum niveocremeum HHB9708]